MSFVPEQAGRLQDAFAEVFKGRVDLFPGRTRRLRELLDREVGRIQDPQAVCLWILYQFMRLKEKPYGFSRN